MGSTLTKAFMAFVIGLAVVIGFTSLVLDVQKSYHVENTTGFVGNLKSLSEDNVDDLTTYTGDMSSDVQGVKELNFIGTIVGSIVDAIKLPFVFLAMVIGFITEIFSFLNLPDIIFKLLRIAISMLIIYGVLKLILGREKI